MDTSGSSDVLFSNARKLDVDIADVEAVFVFALASGPLRLFKSCSDIVETADSRVCAICESFWNQNNKGG